MTYLYAAIIIILVIIMIAVIFILSKRGSGDEGPVLPESGVKRAGRKGEKIASYAISKVLRDDDILLTNVHISYRDKVTELDNVVINKNGVFIIEVKNYKGRLYGRENDFEWIKRKNDGYGNTFVKKVKNPIRQLKRQIYILANFLKYYGVNMWVNGYIIILQAESPVNSPYVLKTLSDIDNALHRPGKKRYSSKTIEKVREILK